MLTKTGHLILAFALGLLVATNTVQVWHIVVLAFLLGVTNSLDAPARLTIIADLVGHDELSSGVALNSIMFHVSRIIGTTLAGIALVEVGAAWCFLLNGISSIAVIGSLLLMHDGAVNLVTSTLSPLQRVKEGLRFSRRHGTIAPLLLLAVIASLFTNNIGALLPAFTDEILHSPTQAYADINQMMGVGAIIGALLMPLLGSRYRRGRVVTAMTAFSGVVALLATQTVSTSSAVILMALFSFGMVLQFATVNTLIQNEVPDEFRGRVMSLYTVTWFGLSPFGTLFLGAIAEGIGTPQAMALYTLAGTILSLMVVARSAKMRRLP
jgi:MFS family permease